MAGCRKLTHSEILSIITKGFDGKYKSRNLCLFVFLLKTGLRIQEALFIEVEQVYDPNGIVRDKIGLTSGQTKGSGRLVKLNSTVKNYLTMHYDKSVEKGQRYLFASGIESSRPGQPMSRRQGTRVIKNAFVRAGIDLHRTGTHCCRKTFAYDIFEGSSKDWDLTRKSLGHKYISSTQSYIDGDSEEVDELIESIGGLPIDVTF